MGMYRELLEKKNLPALLPREQMLKILQAEVYGALPQKPETLIFEDEGKVIPHFCAGKAVCRRITAKGLLEGKEFSFPFYATLPTDGKRHPFFIHINFRPDVPDRYMPSEELIDEGFAVLSFCYEDVTKDDGDFTDGLAGVLFEDGKRGGKDPGKIALWAWAAQRVMDYAEERADVLDLSCATVCGHSRLGKTALLAGATDERIAFVYSNNSGCSGAAITRGKQGEQVRDICKRFPYWFCENYQKYIDQEEKMPFDQHFLVASVAPRKVLIGSASEDLWADPSAEELCCLAASPAFEKGFIYEERERKVGDAFLKGDIGYHLREGEHYFSRADWHQLIQFIRYHQEG